MNPLACLWWNGPSTHEYVAIGVGYQSNELSAMEDAGRAVLERAMAEPTIDGVDARPHLTNNRPAPALIAFAADADLLVVGSRGLGRVSGAVLGSVSRQLLHHAACPAVVL